MHTAQRGLTMNISSSSRLMNKIKPGSIPKIHTSGNAMKLRENAGFFQQAVLAYGVGENDVFQAVDLFDKKNIAQVTVCISALNR